MPLFNLKGIELDNINELNEDINFLINYKIYKKIYFNKFYNLLQKNQYSIGDLIYVSSKKEGFWCKIIEKRPNNMYRVVIKDDIYIDDRFRKNERFCVNSAYFITYVDRKTTNNCFIM